MSSKLNLASLRIDALIFSYISLGTEYFTVDSKIILTTIPETTLPLNINLSKKSNIPNCFRFPIG